MASVFKNIFITVGTTEFDQLIENIDHEEFVNILALCSCQILTIQIGRGIVEPSKLPELCTARGILYVCFRFKPNLNIEMRSSDLVISHSGAGSILEALSLAKPLIVVVNETLQENHQSELAYELSLGNNCISTVPSNLIEEFKKCLQEEKLLQFLPFPQPDYSLFPNHVKGLFTWDPSLFTKK